MLSKTSKFLSISSVAYKEKSFSLFCLLFGVVSGSFQPVLAFYDLFCVSSVFASDNVKECFDMQTYFKSTSCRFYDKMGQALLQRGTADVSIRKLGKCYYKVGQLFALQNGANVITKQSNFYYKLGQIL